MRADQHPDYDGHEEVVFAQDPASGLAAIIAIHSTVRGPAAGGCRWERYNDAHAALGDALRLSRGMSFKNAMADLPAGGGKAVIWKAGPDREAVLEAFGRQVESLGGRYITAVDAGVSMADMEIVARQTRHVAGLAPVDGRAGGDPSPWTALGVFLSLREVLGGSMKGRRVAVQGVGAVGLNLCRLLHDDGAHLVVADVDRNRAIAAQNLFCADVETVERIHAVAADVFAPCALGGVLNGRTVEELGAPMVCGAANNQLATPCAGDRLAGRGVTYCPDYVVNAGGIISVMAEHLGEATSTVDERVRAIPGRLAAVFERACNEGKPAHAVADVMAAARLMRAPSLEEAA